jgi:Uma2 family endonuclease
MDRPSTYIHGMSEAAHLPRMTADEFIVWAMEQPRGRFELVGGEVVAMAPERLIHAEVKGMFFRRLAEEIEQLGLNCSAFPDGVTVRIDDTTLYEPDTLLRCGPKLPGNTVQVTDPLVVVEVRSRSTQALDAGIKLLDYFRLPSLRHYLIVRAEERTVIHHERRGDGEEIATRIIRDGGEVALDPPGIVLRDLFPSP